MAPIGSRIPDSRMEFGLQTARKALRCRNPVIERTAISHVSKNFRGDPQPGKVLAVRSASPGAPQKSKLRRSTATARKGHAIVTVHHDGRVVEPGGISRAKVRVKDLHSHSVRALLASRPK